MLIYQKNKGIILSFCLETSVRAISINASQNFKKLKNNKSLAKKQKGKIILQVQSSGEAYYVDFKGNMHYLKNGTEAYKIMKTLGLGIKNSDLKKIAIE